MSSEMRARLSCREIADFLSSPVAWNPTDKCQEPRGERTRGPIYRALRAAEVKERGIVSSHILLCFDLFTPKWNAIRKLTRLSKNVAAFIYDHPLMECRVQFTTNNLGWDDLGNPIVNVMSNKGVLLVRFYPIISPNAPVITNSPGIKSTGADLAGRREQI